MALAATSQATSAQAIYQKAKEIEDLPVGSSARELITELNRQIDLYVRKIKLSDIRRSFFAFDLRAMGGEDEPLAKKG